MAMREKTFSNGLVVKHRKSGIFFEDANPKDENQDHFKYDFEPEAFREFCDYIETIADDAWTNVIPKDASSAASDYDEYYDRKYDNNGYLTISDTGLRIQAPYYSKDTLYQFNKPKIQSFIYDLRKKVI